MFDGRLLLVLFVGMWLGACTPTSKPGQMAPSSLNAPMVGEYLGQTPSDGYGGVSVWKFRDGVTTCYVTRQGHGVGTACVQEATQR